MVKRKSSNQKPVTVRQVIDKASVTTVASNTHQVLVSPLPSYLESWTELQALYSQYRVLRARVWFWPKDPNSLTGFVGVAIKDSDWSETSKGLDDVAEGKLAMASKGVSITWTPTEQSDKDWKDTADEAATGTDFEEKIAFLFEDCPQSTAIGKIFMDMTVQFREFNL